MSKIFKIPCSWVSYGVLEIEAESLEEAINTAYDDSPLPEDSSYLDGSFTVGDKQMIDYLNNVKKEVK